MPRRTNRPEPTPIPTPPPPRIKELNENDLKAIIYKLHQCINCECLCAMESDFNKIGLTIQTTSKDRIVLCRVEDGKPITEHVIDDYIFIGEATKLSTELSERAVEKISSFIQANAGPSETVRNNIRSWRDGLRMAGAPIEITNEDVNKVAGEMIID